MTTDTVDNLLNQWEEERPDVQSDSLGIVVRIQHLSKLLTDSASEALAALNLSMWEYDVLSILRRQGAPFGLSATELAAEGRLSTGAMTNRIDRLADKGLVARSTDERDRRAIRVRLTSAGQALISTALEIRLEAAEESLQKLTEAERTVLATLLRKLLLFADGPGH